MDASWPEANYFDDANPIDQLRLSELELVARANFFELYHRKADGSYWRLDMADRYQQRFLIRIAQPDSWAKFDASALEIALLLSHRGGLASGACVQLGCNAAPLQGSAFCPDHAYAQGLRR
jgi:hypothetical protein